MSCETWLSWPTSVRCSPPSQAPCAHFTVSYPIRWTQQFGSCPCPTSRVECDFILYFSEHFCLVNMCSVPAGPTVFSGYRGGTLWGVTQSHSLYSQCQCSWIVLSEWKGCRHWWSCCALPNSHLSVCGPRWVPMCFGVGHEYLYIFPNTKIVVVVVFKVLLEGWTWHEVCTSWLHPCLPLYWSMWTVFWWDRSHYL